MKFKVLILSLFFAVGLNINAYADFVSEHTHGDIQKNANGDCVVPCLLDKEHDVPGVLEWLEEKKDCGDIGLGCTYVDVPCPRQIVIKEIEGGYEIRSFITEVTISFTTDSVNWSTFTKDPSFHRFAPNQTMVIGKNDKFPFLSNLQIKLEGVITDENGEFVVRIPKP